MPRPERFCFSSIRPGEGFGVSEVDIDDYYLRNMAAKWTKKTGYHYWVHRVWFNGELWFFVTNVGREGKFVTHH